MVVPPYGRKEIIADYVRILVFHYQGLAKTKNPEPDYFKVPKIISSWPSTLFLLI
jgi:hypothetical protein